MGAQKNWVSVGVWLWSYSGLVYWFSAKKHVMSGSDPISTQRLKNFFVVLCILLDNNWADIRTFAKGLSYSNRETTIACLAVYKTFSKSRSNPNSALDSLPLSSPVLELKSVSVKAQSEPIVWTFCLPFPLTAFRLHL